MGNEYSLNDQYHLNSFGALQGGYRTLTAEKVLPSIDFENNNRSREEERMLNTEKQAVINVLLTLNQHISDHISIGYQSWVKDVNYNLEGLTRSTSSYAKCLAESLTEDIERVRNCLALIFNDGGNKEDNESKDDNNAFGPENVCQFTTPGVTNFPVYNEFVANGLDEYGQYIDSPYLNADNIYSPPGYYGTYHNYGYDDQECCYFDPMNNESVMVQSPPSYPYHDYSIYNSPTQYYDGFAAQEEPEMTYISFDCNSELCNCCTACSTCFACLNLKYSNEQVKLYPLNGGTNVKETSVNNNSIGFEENCEDCKVGHEFEADSIFKSLEAEISVDKETSCVTSTCTKEEEKPKRKKKPFSRCKAPEFYDVYELTGDNLGKGSCGSVYTCKNIKTQKEYAVKVIEKGLASHPRSKILKEIEMFHHCQGHPNIAELIEYFEEENHFYLVFEKLNGGELLKQIERHGKFTETEASSVIRDLAKGLKFIHDKGIAHRDLKPQYVLCALDSKITPVKICDFDLGSGIRINSRGGSTVSSPVLRSPVGTFEFMAPEVVELWMDDTDVDLHYDKRCDLWSLGVILYVLLCGYPPYIMNCGEKNCGWNGNASCDQCLHQLFDCIHDGELKFPEEEWSNVSDSAKDLVEKLLVKRACERLNAEMVLDHPWIKSNGCDKELCTYQNLANGGNAEAVSNYADSAMKVHRIVIQHTAHGLAENVSHTSCEIKQENPMNLPSKGGTFNGEWQNDSKIEINKNSTSESNIQCDINNNVMNIKESALFKRRKKKSLLSASPAG